MPPLRDELMPNEACSGSLALDDVSNRSEPVKRRIGLLAVHGIGEQGRFQFLDGLVRDLDQAFRHAAGNKASVSVSLKPALAAPMGAAAPCLSDGPEPSAEIVLVDRERGVEVRVGIHEVWWGDIADPPTLLRPLKFLAWGLAMWAVPLKFRRALETDKPGTVGQFLVEAEPAEGRGFFARRKVQAQLFLVAYLVVVIGLVLSLGLTLVRLVTRLKLPDPVQTAIGYMSDIKLYTQPTSPDTVPLDHLGQHARCDLQR